MAQNYVLLETINLTQTVTSVTFDNLPTSGYTDLKIVMSARGSSSNTNYEPIGLRINGSAPNHVYKYLTGTGSVTQASGSTNETFTATTAGGTWTRFSGSGLQAGGTTSNFFGVGELNLPDYRSSTTKLYSFDSATENNGTQAYIELNAGHMTSSAPITSVSLAFRDGSIVANSTFGLYGLASFGTTPVTAPFATGGNIVANDGTYWYHAFLSSGTFTPLKALSCDYLVVAGGGGGGTKNSNGGGAGGGGAGGLRSTVTSTGGGGTLETALALPGGTGIAVIVGAGGTGTNVQATSATNGSNSSFIGGAVSITSIGGGRGGNQGTTAKTGATGGSGGGAGIDGGDANQAGGAGTANQGFAGGNSVSGYPYRGSGGGGAGAAAALASSSQNGGAGVLISAFATPTTTGVSGYYAGGGGGAGDSNNGSGGAGGGGAGHPNGGSGTSGTTNTGGGGGGTNNTYGVSNGGSGIVIVRYPMV